MKKFITILLIALTFLASVVSTHVCPKCAIATAPKVRICPIGQLWRNKVNRCSKFRGNQKCAYGYVLTNNQCEFYYYE